MASDKIGMQVRQDYMLDRKGMLGSESNVLVDVSLGINDDGRARFFVSYQVGSVRQTSQIELLEDHVTPPSLSHSHVSIVLVG